MTVQIAGIGSIFIALIGLCCAHAALAQSPDPVACVESLEAGTYGNVARGIFTTGIENREPVDQLETWDPDTVTIYFFTDIRDGTGTRVRHRWLRNGNLTTEVGFNIGGPRWRVWSSKRYVGEETDNWAVDVVDERGCRLGQWALTAAPVEDEEAVVDLIVAEVVDEFDVPVIEAEIMSEDEDVEEIPAETVAIGQSTEEEISVIVERETEAGGRYSYGFAGRLEMNGTSIDDDNTSYSSGTYVRRARITVNGTAGRNWSSRYTYDFKNERTIVANVGFKFRHGEAVLGQFKAEFSLENMMSTTFQPLLERSLVGETLGAERGLGIGLAFSGRQSTMHVAFQGENVNDSEPGSPKTYSARLTHAFVRQQGAIVHAGISALKQEIDNTGNARFGAVPGFRGSGSTTSMVDTGPIPNSDDYTSFSFEWAALRGPFSGQGEFFKTDLKRTGSPDANFNGWYLMASYFPWGGTRGYFIDKGVYGRPSLDFEQGAWEFAARYDRVDLDDGTIMGGEQENWTLGVNYYRKFVRVSANFVNASVTGGINGNEDVSAFTLMTQFSF